MTAPQNLGASPKPDQGFGAVAGTIDHRQIRPHARRKTGVARPERTRRIAPRDAFAGQHDDL